jgi:hypothetical protein
VGHSFPHETKFSAQDKARQGDEEEAEYQERKGDEAAEE